MTPEIHPDPPPAETGPVRRGNPAARVLIAPIRFYQRFISPGLPATCRYYPTCSAYAVEALQIHGVLRGTWLALRRLGRCQPWSRREHFDPVPPLSRRELRARRREPHTVDGDGTVARQRDSRSASSECPTPPAPADRSAADDPGKDQGRAGEPVGAAGSSSSGPRTARARRDIRVPTPAIGTIDHPVRRRPA